MTQGVLLVAPAGCPIPCSWKWLFTEAAHGIHPDSSCFAPGVCGRVCPCCHGPRDTALRVTTASLHFVSLLPRPFIKLKENGRTNISRSSSSTSSFSSTAGESETLEEYDSVVGASPPHHVLGLIPPTASVGMHWAALGALGPGGHLPRSGQAVGFWWAGVPWSVSRSRGAELVAQEKAVSRSLRCREASRPQHRHSSRTCLSTALRPAATARAQAPQPLPSS